MIQEYKKSGFTLVETLVYIGIFAIVFTVIVQFSLVTLENNRVAVLRKELGDLILLNNSSLEESFASSSSIDLVNSVFDIDNGKISLNLIAGGTIQYSLQNNKINIIRAGISNDLSTSDFICDKFRVTNIINDAVSVGAIIEVRCTSIKYPQVNTEFKSNYLIL